MLFATFGLDYPRRSVSVSPSVANAPESDIAVYVMVMTGWGGMSPW